MKCSKQKKKTKKRKNELSNVETVVKGLVLENIPQRFNSVSFSFKPPGLKVCILSRSFVSSEYLLVHNIL